MHKERKQFAVETKSVIILIKYKPLIVRYTDINGIWMSSCNNQESHLGHDAYKMLKP